LPKHKDSLETEVLQIKRKTKNEMKMKNEDIVKQDLQNVNIKRWTRIAIKLSSRPGPPRAVEPDEKRKEGQGQSDETLCFVILYICILSHIVISRSLFPASVFVRLQCFNT
jgi:hypothetical protein